VEVAWKDDLGKDFDCHAHFKGLGCTTEERRASMQRQLAALCSSITFLAPESWGPYHCLTSMDLAQLAAETMNMYLTAATQATALTHLGAIVNDASSITALGGLSNLRGLTSLYLYSASPPAAAAPHGLTAGAAAIAQLSHLRHLGVDGALIGRGVAAAPAGIPSCWTSLTALTLVSLERCGCLALPQLSALVAVEHVNLSDDDIIGVGDISSLFALSRLTSLDGPAEFIPPETADGAAPGGAAGGAAGSGVQLVVPQQWRQGLRRLSWREHSRSSLSMLAQLTSLTVLKLVDAVVSQQLCR
jgi:hypothetical protein